MFSFGNLTSYVPPVPMAPIRSDFVFCHSDYGAGLRRQDGIYAGGILPQGTMPVNYFNTQDEEGGRYWDYELPFDVSFGGVSITVAVAGPVNIHEISLVPNRVRGMAAFLANTCVGERGVGGFITHKIQGLVDFVTNPTSDLDAPSYPESAAFITLSMSSANHAHSFPGDYDPIMATFLQRAESLALERVTTPLQQAEIADRSIRYTVQAHRMKRLGTVSWWSDFQDRNMPVLGNQLSTAQRSNGTTRNTATSRRQRRLRSFGTTKRSRTYRDG